MFDSLKGEHFDGNAVVFLQMVQFRFMVFLLSDFSAFLSKLILAETELLGRGAYYNAKLMASRQSASSSSLEDFCNTLCAKCSQGAMPEKDTAGKAAGCLDFSNCKRFVGSSGCPADLRTA